MPGTYQGAEAGANFDYGDAGALSFSYMWTNEYKAPWHLEMDEFIRTIKPPKLIIYTPLGRSTTSKITSYWKRRLVRPKGISINICQSQLQI
ncbi:chitoporin [Escherichia coli]|nr:chitoporin [Escherichia coli]